MMIDRIEVENALKEMIELGFSLVEEITDWQAMNGTKEAE